jgi:hypothetical protein
MEEAVRIRSDYTTNYYELNRLETEFVATEAQRIELGDSLISLSFFKGWFVEKRYRQLSEQAGQLNASRLDTRVDLMQSQLEAKRHWENNMSTYYNGALIEAAKEGVSIKTNDYFALEKAQWQAANIGEGQDLYSPVEAMRIDTLTSEELERNLQQYPEMAWEFSDNELATARRSIARLPLTHTTQEGTLLDSFGESASTGIFSFSKLQQEGLLATEYGGKGVRGFTAMLDEKMGLHKYVFMCLGSPYPSPHDDGRAGVAVITSDLLYDERCIVTPDDIAHICPDVFHGDGIEYQRDLDSLEKYRTAVVSGKGWVEILTRRLARHQRESPDTPYPIENCLTMGEIKFRDEVPSTAIAAMLTSEEAVQEYMRLLRDDTIAWPVRSKYFM